MEIKCAYCFSMCNIEDKVSSAAVVFCDKACYDKYYSASAELPDRVCRRCGKIIKRPVYDALGVLPDQPFCSSECLERARDPFIKASLVDTSPIERREEPLLHRAQELICGDRQRDYGDKLQNFAQTAMIWTGILAHKLQPGQSITPEDVCLLMMGLKMSRLAKSPGHEDSWLDIAGYVGCADMLRAEREKGVTLSGNTMDSGK